MDVEALAIGFRGEGPGALGRIEDLQDMAQVLPAAWPGLVAP